MLERLKQGMVRGALALVFAILVAAVAAPVGAAVVFIPVYIPIPVQVPDVRTGGCNDIHNVAVLSAIGTGPALRNNHILGPKRSGMDISSWRVDDLVNSMMRQYLGNRFAFRDVPFDRVALSDIPNGPWNNSTGAVQKYLGKLDNAGLDAFILIRPDLEYQAPGSSDLALEDGNGISDTLPVLWANYEIDIVDAHNYSVVARAYSRVSLRESEPDSFAGLIADQSLKLDDTFSMTDTQRNTLHLYVTKLITASVIESLRSP